MKLRGKLGLITGAAQGIGKGIAMEMAREGADIVLADINEDKVRETFEKEIRNICENAKSSSGYFKLDVCNEEEVQRVVHEILSRYRRIDFLINNAGVLTSCAIVDLDERDWDRVLDTNLKGTFLVTKTVLKHMIERKGGRIVNVASDCGISGKAYQSHYCSSKFGIVGFTQSAALEVAEHNILVNAVCPGPVDTELRRKDVAMKAKARGITFEDLEGRENKSIPLGKRPAEAEEIGRLVVFLVSDDNSFITGEAINISGGLEFH